MDAFQRDLGRVEGKMEFIQRDVEAIKADVEDIKSILQGQQAVKVSDWKRLSFVGVLFTIANQIITWTRPFA